MGGLCCQTGGAAGAVILPPVPELQPLTPSVDLSRRTGSFRFRSRVADPDQRVFAVDLYSHLRESHPETHVGYWVFPLPAGEAENTIGIDLTTIGPGSLWMETPDGRRAALDCWANPDYVFDPVIGIQLVLRDRAGKVLENRFVAGKVADPEVLKAYYKRTHSGGGYTPSEPFLFELHATMLRRLEALFLRHVPPGGRVIDAGCGRSLFTEIRSDWPFRVIAADVDPDLILSRQREHPWVRWAVAGALQLPIRDGAADAVFAGELIEHLPDPEAGLREFLRVLKPGGALVLTTPNRLRLSNVADGSERPYSPDHLSELSYDELDALLPRCGFDVVERTGVHLELLLNWFSRLPKLDRLQRAWNRPWALPLMRATMSAGALAPRYALDLIFVARKRA
jgi:SAM-dependent methyltransferase